MTYANPIDVRGLAKTYGNVTAVARLNLTVKPGEIFGFLGPNGAGKTTSVKMLVGLVRPTAGEGTVLGARLGDRAARKRLGYLPELFRYPDWLTAREVLRFHARLALPGRAGGRHHQAAIDRVLELIGLSGRSGDRVGTYSKGMQQRLGLGVALLGDPALVMLDEPTSALDPIGRHDVREILRSLKANGTSVFLNSHLLTEVEQVCDRIAIVSQGSVVAEGTIAEIVGVQSAVRVRAAANGTPLEPVLQRFGAVSRHTDAFVVTGLARDRVPDLVQALVAVDARVFAVEPLAASLEERFLQIAGGAQA